MNQHWTITDIPWDSFQPEKVDIHLLSIIKAASLVEYNAPDYQHYLENIFQEGEVPREEIRAWAQDEVHHGLVLAAWAKKADPHFDLETSLHRFHQIFRVPLDASHSIRGSHVGEFIARCVVETGTSSFYTALAEKAHEPVLKKICYSIAADEFRHYKFFYSYLVRFLKKNPMSKVARLRIAFQRIRESQSAELASAYYAANMAPDTPYEEKHFSSLYLSRVWACYEPRHIQRAMGMICKATGFRPHSTGFRFLASAFWYIFATKYRKYASKKDTMDALEPRFAS